MGERDSNVLTGVIFDETCEIELVELCEICAIEKKMVEKMVQEGILDPVDSRHGEPRFQYSSVRRTRTVIHLQRDLGVNLAGAALALDLLDRIENLRARLRGTK